VGDCRSGRAPVDGNAAVTDFFHLPPAKPRGVGNVGSWLSIALGPALSAYVPMASDLRALAAGFAGLVSLATTVWLTARFVDAVRRDNAMATLGGCLALAVLFGFVYVAIHWTWTTETGGIGDQLWPLALIGSFGLSAGGITGALVALEYVIKPSRP